MLWVIIGAIVVLWLLGKNSQAQPAAPAAPPAPPAGGVQPPLPANANPLVMPYENADATNTVYTSVDGLVSGTDLSQVQAYNDYLLYGYEQPVYSARPGEAPAPSSPYGAYGDTGG